MKKSLLDKYSKFANLFLEGKSKTVELQLESNGRSKLNKLAEDIGFSTDLNYNEDGIFNIEFGMLKEQFWKTERPCFAKEENKVLNVIHALLISSAENMEEERDFATLFSKAFWNK